MCTYTVRSYFFRYDNYNKYKETGNEFIFKSTFGIKHKCEVEKEIKEWFNACIGAFCIIKEKERYIKESEIYG